MLVITLRKKLEINDNQAQNRLGKQIAPRSALRCEPCEDEHEFDSNSVASAEYIGTSVMSISMFIQVFRLPCPSCTQHRSVLEI